MSKILTYDLETTTQTQFKRKASPFCKDNYVVAAGYSYDGGKSFGTYFTDSTGYENSVMPFKEDTKLLVGFNIKFDLLYSWRKPELVKFFKNGGRVWDCQYAEYLLEGHRQHAQMCSMDSIIEKYGGTLKIDAVKELWNAGVNTPDIPEDLLMDYLLGNEEEGIEGDVNNTYLIFKAQVARATKIHPNFLQMLKNRMDGLCATTEMEYNGLCIDTVRGEKDRTDLFNTVNRLENELNAFIPKLPDGLEFNWRSIYHKSYLIYGGTAKYQKWVQHSDSEGTDGLAWASKTEQWPLFSGEPVRPTACIHHSESDDNLYRHDGMVQDIYKSGKRKGEGKTKNVTVDDLTKPKGAKQDHFFKFKGFTKPDRRWQSSCTDGADKAIYSTSADVIEILGGRKDVPFLKALGERAKASKDLGTYYWAEDAKSGERKGMLTLVGEDGIIHHKLNHTSTITSRLSSSDPNMQNIPRGDKSVAKAMFTSRFGSQGSMAEIDYSQLEVVVQGILSRDPQLIADLNAKVDFHCKRLAAKLNESYESVIQKCKVDEDPAYLQMRTEIKGFTFQRAYGAGAAAIAASTGMTEDEVTQLILVEERLYPGIVRFDQIVEQSIEATRKVTKSELFVAGQRFQAAVGEWFSPTGTRYVWTEGEAPKFLHKHGKFVGFSPTERKNWPIQGTGGEIVQTMLGKVWRWFVANDNFGGKALLVNTVHDCVWLDCHSGIDTDTVIAGVKAILEAVPQVFNANFNMNIDVPFPTEAEVGPNMLELKHVHL